MDDITMAEHRQKVNQQGTARMMGEYVQQQGSAPLDQGVRNQLLGMSIAEGVDLPTPAIVDQGQAQRERLELEDRPAGVKAGGAGCCTAM